MVGQDDPTAVRSLVLKAVTYTSVLLWIPQLDKGTLLSVTGVDLNKQSAIAKQMTVTARPLLSSSAGSTTILLVSMFISFNTLSTVTYPIREKERDGDEGERLSTLRRDVC